MIDSKTADEINRIAEKYDSKASAVLPALTLVGKDKNGTISSQDLADLSELLHLPVGEIRSVASFYSLFHIDRPIGKYHLQVDMSISAILTGARKMLNSFQDELGVTVGETTPDGMFTLSAVEDLASGGTVPVVRVNSIYYENMTEEKVCRLIASLRKDVLPPSCDSGACQSSICHVLIQNRAFEIATDIESYKKNGGYRALEKARQMTPDEIIGEVKRSKIRGRGGAGFPTGAKWHMIPRNSKKPVYLICNADEGEPGTFKDRQIMENDPHLLIEGMAIAARAVGARKGYIYIRGELAWIADLLTSAIAEAKADGWLDRLDLIVHQGGGSYVCGEETALIESLEGRRGHPRTKPPFPTVQGLYGCPTLVNNVETLAAVPFIVTKGGAAFRKIGFADNDGSKLFAVSGHVNRPGIYEYPMGVPFNALLGAAGGVKGALKAAIVGGLSAPMLTADELADLTMDDDSCKKHGTSLGSRGVIVINADASIPELALRASEFYEHESCGKCTPCREGSHVISAMLKKINDGHGSRRDIDKIVSLADHIRSLGFCPVGRGLSDAVKTMIEKFRGEFEALCS